MSLKPLIGAPGSFYEADAKGNPVLDEHGRRKIVKIADFTQYETSEPIVDREWSMVVQPRQMTINGWRFTCATWPDPRVQQCVSLIVGYEKRVTIALSSILTVIVPETVPLPAADQGGRLMRVLRDRDFLAEKIDPQIVLLQDMKLTVRLDEPMGECGLRLHLRGVRR